MIEDRDKREPALTRLLDWAAGQVAVMRTSYATGEDGWICDEEIREEVKQVEADIAALSDEDATGGADHSRDFEGSDPRGMGPLPGEPGNPNPSFEQMENDTPPQQRDALESFKRISLKAGEAAGFLHGGEPCGAIEEQLNEDRETVRHALTNYAAPTVPEAVRDLPELLRERAYHTDQRAGNLNDADCEAHILGREVVVLRGVADELDRALAQSGEGRAGWKLVPVEPTEAMLKAASDAFNAAKEPEDWSQGGDIGDDNADVYRAMLAAAPEPGPEKDRPHWLPPHWTRQGPGQYTRSDGLTIEPTDYYWRVTPRSGKDVHLRDKSIEEAIAWTDRHMPRARPGEGR